MESYDRLLTDVLSANLAKISVQQNSDMRKISAWVAIAAVPTMIAGIYGMNFDNMPELHWHYGYFMVLGVMGAPVPGCSPTLQAGEVAVDRPAQVAVIQPAPRHEEHEAPSTTR